MKENERLLLFYEECVKKGYSDMTDPQQALKAKVIATDMELRYGNSVEKLFQKAKAASEEQKVKRVEAERKAAEEKRIAAEEKRRRAVSGKELIKFYGSSSTVTVFKRPDGSFYCTTDKNPKTRIEGKPTIYVKSSAATLFTYHPSDMGITTVSSGGISSGAVWQTDPWVSASNNITGKAYLTVSANGDPWEVYTITVSPLIKDAFKRYPCQNEFIKRGLKSREIKCHNYVKNSLYGMAAKDALESGNVFRAVTAAPFAADEERLPAYQIKEVAKLLCQILDGPWPEDDEQAYERGKKLIVSDKSTEILEGISLLQEISVNHPRKESAKELVEQNKGRYHDVLQAEKEAAVIKKEEEERKQKKTFTIGILLLCACIGLPFLWTQVIIPHQKYSEAMGMIDAGNYGSGYAALEEIGSKKALTAIAASKYDRAMERIDAQDYETALALLDGMEYKDSEEKRESIKPNYYREAFAKAVAGDSIVYGSYEQDGQTSNGKEGIEWLVLAKKDNKLLVISQCALDCQLFNTKYENVTWENCTLREWLNEEFFNAAFSEGEKTMIHMVTVSADKNPYYHTAPGNATQDKVFLLSITEANRYFKSDEARACVLTSYAKKNGAYTKGGWWLRSPGHSQDVAVSVNYGGNIDSYGDTVIFNSNCVRPAMWIDLSA